MNCLILEYSNNYYFQSAADLESVPKWYSFQNPEMSPLTWCPSVKSWKSLSLMFMTRFLPGYLTVKGSAWICSLIISLSVELTGIWLSSGNGGRSPWCMKTTTVRFTLKNTSIYLFTYIVCNIRNVQNRKPITFPMTDMVVLRANLTNHTPLSENQVKIRPLDTLVVKGAPT